MSDCVLAAQFICNKYFSTLVCVVFGINNSTFCTSFCNFLIFYVINNCTKCYTLYCVFVENKIIVETATRTRFVQ